MPAEVYGFNLVGGGMVDGDVPDLTENDPLPEWVPECRGRGPPFYVRLQDTHEGKSLPFGHVKRLSKLGEIWVDCRIEDPEDLLDFLFSGPTRIIMWRKDLQGDEEEWLDGLHEVGMIGIDAKDLDWGLQVAQEYDLGLVVKGDASRAEESELDVYEWHDDGDAPWRFRLEEVSSRPAAPEGDAPADMPEAPRAIL